MAIQEHDREDLLGEGRNMPWRGQCTIDGVQVVIGFRDQGQASMFCGTDPVFQFNRKHELRRVFFQATRFRAENGRLIAMARDSRGGKIEFVSQPIDSGTEAALLSSLRSWLSQIRRAKDSGSWRVEGEPASQFQSRLSDWLAGLPDPVVIAAVPNA